MLQIGPLRTKMFNFALVGRTCWENVLYMQHHVTADILVHQWTLCSWKHKKSSKPNCVCVCVCIVLPMSVRYLSYRRKMLLRSSLTCSSSSVTSSLDTQEMSSTILCCMARHVRFSSYKQHTGLHTAALPSLTV